MDKRLIISRVFTLYLYYAICISKREYERLSKLLRNTKWLSKLPHMLGQLDCCGLQIHLAIQAHVSLALCPNSP